ncbi:MAG: hypothetical protein QOE25_423 [Actinomycetota bacterium]|nr:hypothetical protein [Actinomycetota bacterium]
MGGARLKRQTKKRVVEILRPRFGPTGVLPGFLLIGVPRGGTTTCFRQLIRHPQVGPPLRKEIRFFDTQWDRGDRFYRRCFPTTRQMQAYGWRLTGEATPRYLEHPDAPGRAAALVPEARIVVLLRDPVIRAWSHYQMYVRSSREQRSFADAVRDEIAEPMDPRGSRGRSYLGAGNYAPQLRRWFAAFPRENFLILLSEEYFADGAAAQGRIHEHLGLEPFVVPSVRLNSSGGGGDGLDPDVDQMLRNHFAPGIRETAELLGVAIPWLER